jgi:hypothetical protein
MSDNRRTYRAIKGAIRQLCPTEPRGNAARHLHTLAALISGIVGSRRTNLPAIAGNVPDGTKRESRVKKYYRWLTNERIGAELYFLPFVDALLESLAHLPLVLAIDGSELPRSKLRGIQWDVHHLGGCRPQTLAGHSSPQQAGGHPGKPSEVGRGCMALMVSLIYRKRALPLAWIVVKGHKGHFPEDAHVELVRQVHALIPEGSLVVFLGDGEFDGTELQATLDGFGWQYVSRTAKNAQLHAEDEWFTFEDLGIERGACIGVPDVLFTRKAYGPVLALAVWDEQYKEPIYLVTNMELVDEACYWYGKRYCIETFFSDQKTRGFHLNKSHIDDPVRLSRLMIAACLAYIWIIFLGTLAMLEGWVSVIHRTDRCDLSLFQLGLRLLEHFLNDDLPIPVAFQMLELGVFA